MSQISRRDFLRSAGGVTFLALVPNGRGLFAAPGTTLPLFTALPYVQPGPASGLVHGQEAMVVAWQTETVPVDFMLDYGPAKTYGKTAPISRAERWSGDSIKRFNYAASLSGPHLSKTYYYRLRGGGKTIAERYFATRKKRGEQTRFVAFGDNAYGDPGQRAVAYYAYQAHTDMPLRFAPGDLTKALPGPHISDRRIPGTFTRDTKFDGKSVTKPNGIIYITTGAGGKELHDLGFDDHPELWRHADNNNVAYVSRFVSIIHSFMVFDVHGSSLVMTQIGEDGKELDRITVMKV